MGTVREHVETALVLSVAQILEGDVACAYCESPAVVTIATGADPEPEAVCAEHSSRFIDTARAVVRDCLGMVV